MDKWWIERYINILLLLLLLLLLSLLLLLLNTVPHLSLF